MREILFKAKRKDNGEWVEGYYRADPDLNMHFICGWDYYPSENGLEREPFEYEIDSDTLCQYTGLTDKNGKKVWENDLLRYSYDYPGSPWLKVKGLSDKDIKYSIGAVFWSDWRGAWAVCGRGTNRYRVEVIGNIFDNPELLRGGAE